jgi:hypothetical protein
MKADSISMRPTAARQHRLDRSFLVMDQGHRREHSGRWADAVGGTLTHCSNEMTSEAQLISMMRKGFLVD